MPDDPKQHTLPAAIADAIAGIPKQLVPTSLKALDRLMGAAVDIPAAWLAQHKARVDAQTAAFTLVENAIASAAATEAAASPELVRQAVDVLVRKSYRKQRNVNAVSSAAIADLRTNESNAQPKSDAAEEIKEIDDDWLNIFERYAEDASTDRMQKLWGRVLAGEIRRPGRYSMRTLRFLSQFSQEDALLFAQFSTSAFAQFAPKRLVKPEDTTDIRHLMSLEAAGLIQGSSGTGLELSLTFDDQGHARLHDDGLWIVFVGEPKSKIKQDGLALTPLGVELLSLLPGRDARAAARKVAEAFRQPGVMACYLAISRSGSGSLTVIERVWETASSPIDSAPG